MSTPPPAGSEIGTVLVVCTGNICRSPFIERVLQHGVDEHWGPGALQVSSAGTRALVDHPMEPHAHERLVRQGLAAQDFRSRQVEGAHLRGADLVLVATRRHRAAVVGQEPVALRRTFTVRELGLIAAGMTPADLPQTAAPREWLGSVVSLAGVRRATLAGRPGEQLDIVDPYGRDDSVYDTMAEQILDVVPWVRWVLTGGPRPRAAPVST